MTAWASGESPILGEGVPDRTTAEVAEVEMLASTLLDALLTCYVGVLRPAHRMFLGRLLREGGAEALLQALEDFRLAAASGSPRDEALAAFVRSLMRRELPAAVDQASAEELARVEAEHRAQVGPEAYLLERMALEREAFADDAAGINLEQEARARADAQDLRELAMRHMVHFVGRDVAPRAPCV